MLEVWPFELHWGIGLRLLGNPVACRGHKADGVSPVESRSITPQGGEAATLPFVRTRGFNPRDPYNLIRLLFFHKS